MEHTAITVSAAAWRNQKTGLTQACKHDQGERISAADMLYVDGICPICLQEKLALAVKVVEAAERYKHHSEELREAIENFKENAEGSK